jgi:hypothetical protein
LATAIALKPFSATARGDAPQYNSRAVDPLSHSKFELWSD